MHININSLQTKAIYFKEQLLSTLTPQQKKILMVATLALSCIIAIALYWKCCCNITEKTKGDLDDAGIKAAALKNQINPQVEQPKEKPKAEQPKKEEPKAEQPKEKPETDQPKEKPKADKPEEKPKAEQPKKEKPETDQPKEKPKAEQLKKEEPKAEQPKAEQPKEKPKTDQPKGIPGKALTGADAILRDLFIRKAADVLDSKIESSTILGDIRVRVRCQLCHTENVKSTPVYWKSLMGLKGECFRCDGYVAVETAFLDRDRKEICVVSPESNTDELLDKLSLVAQCTPPAHAPSQPPAHAPSQPHAHAPSLPHAHAPSQSSVSAPSLPHLMSLPSLL